MCLTHSLDLSSGRWYLLETNYDHWKPPLVIDNRRDPVSLTSILCCIRKYSGTSDKGPSEIGTTSLQGTKLLDPKCPLFRGSTVMYHGRVGSSRKSVLCVYSGFRDFHIFLFILLT